MTEKPKSARKDPTRIEGKQAEINLELTDSFLPVSLAIELPGGYVSEVVPAGIRLPHTTTKKYSTAGSFQLAAEFIIDLGNRPLSRDNLELCRMRVRNIKWSGAGVPQIDLTFDISEAGTLTISAANLDNLNAEVVVFVDCKNVSQQRIGEACDDAEAHRHEDEQTRSLIQQMMDTFALIGATNDYYAAAKKKMTFSQKSAYKAARKRVEKALTVDICDATPETIEELDLATDNFRHQQNIVLPLYKKVMAWYK